MDIFLTRANKCASLLPGKMESHINRINYSHIHIYLFISSDKEIYRGRRLIASNYVFQSKISVTINYVIKKDRNLPIKN